MSGLLDYIEKHPKETKRLIGIDYEQLQQLFTQASELHHLHKSKIEHNKIRINEKGAGCKTKLSIPNQILLTLVYLSQYHTFQYLGIQFGVSESTAHNIFHYWLDILSELLPASLVEQVKKKDGDYEWVKEILAGYELTIDSTEQPIQRPLDQEEQEKFYSGKQKKHTMKNQIIILPLGQDIVDVKVGDPGPTSDINQFRERQENFNKEQKFKGDLGYIGEDQINTPHKRPRNKELTEFQKEENKEFSSVRVFVEHVIRVMKVFRIAQEKFRLRRKTYEQIILAVCGLVRLRIRALVLPCLELAPIRS